MNTHIEVQNKNIRRPSTWKKLASSCLLCEQSAYFSVPVTEMFGDVRCCPLVFAVVVVVVAGVVVVVVVVVVVGC